MAAVYSQQFVVLKAFSGGPLTVLTCLPGEVLVVRNITVAFGTNVGPGSWLLAHLASGAVIAGASYASTADVYTENRELRFVMKSGDQLAVATESYTGDFTICGYQLSSPL